jgi:hypothetical protein
MLLSDGVLRNLVFSTFVVGRTVAQAVSRRLLTAGFAPCSVSMGFVVEK